MSALIEGAAIWLVSRMAWYRSIQRRITVLEQSLSVAAEKLYDMADSRSAWHEAAQRANSQLKEAHRRLAISQAIGKQDAERLNAMVDSYRALYAITAGGWQKRPPALEFEPLAGRPNLKAGGWPGAIQ